MTASPYGWASNDVTYVATGLTPGAVYQSMFENVDESGTVVYWLGAQSQVAPPSGRLRWIVGADQLGYTRNVHCFAYTPPVRDEVAPCDLYLGGYAEESA